MSTQFLEEALGFLKKVKEDLQELEDLRERVAELSTENKKLKDANEELEEDNLKYQEDWIDGSQIKEIDCGIGTIRYLQPDNLKLQIVMEELKEKMEHKAMHA